MFCDTETRIGQPHAPLEKKSSEGVVAAKAAINFRVQGTNENEPKPAQAPQVAENVEPRRPAIDHDKIRALFAKDMSNDRKGPQAVSQSAGVEAFSDTDRDTFPNHPVPLSGIGRKNCRLMSPRHQLAG